MSAGVDRHEEGAAVLLEPDGQANLIGSGPAYFLEVKNPPEICRKKTPVAFNGIPVHRVPSDASFNVKDWKGTGGDDYLVSAANGELKARGSDHGMY